MTKPILLQDDFSGGMKPDLPHDKLPKNAVRNMVDFIPNYNDVPLALRNGWDRVGATMSTTYGAAVAFAPFAGGAQLVGIADTGAVFQVPHTSDSANTARGTAQVPIQSPVFYRNVLYIPSDYTGVATVKSYSGSGNAAAASGSPPNGVLCTVFKDHLVLARDASTPNRIWFSSGGDAASWDTAADGQWLDASFPVTGLATIRNMMLVFAEQGVERVRGDIIPGVAGSDMVREPLPIPGCADPASIAVADDVCYYANASGVYMTDGITSVDLTEQCDFKQWWAHTLFSYDGAWNLAGGYFQGKYVVVAHDGSTFKICAVFDVKKRSAYQFSNIPATMFAMAPTGHSASYPGGVYMAERNAPWLGRFSDVFKYISTIEAYSSWGEDDNGTFRSPRLRTGYFSALGNRRIKKLYLHFDLSSSATTLTVNTYSNKNAASATGTFTVSGDGNSGDGFKKLAVARGDREGVAVEITAPLYDAPSTGLSIRRLEAEIQEKETSKR
jgi:hypothetical protein